MAQIDFESLYFSLFSTCLITVNFYHYFPYFDFLFHETNSRYSFTRELPYAIRLHTDIHGSKEGVCFFHPQLAGRQSFQADNVACIQLLYDPSKPVAVLGDLSGRILKQGDCLAIYKESQALTLCRGYRFKKRLGVDIIGSTLKYFQTAIVE